MEKGPGSWHNREGTHGCLGAGLGDRQGLRPLVLSIKSYCTSSQQCSGLSSISRPSSGSIELRRRTKIPIYSETMPRLCMSCPSQPGLLRQYLRSHSTVTPLRQGSCAPVSLGLQVAILMLRTRIRSMCQLTCCSPVCVVEAPMRRREPYHLHGWCAWRMGLGLLKA
jgi:hypothetical protein